MGFSPFDAGLEPCVSRARCGIPSSVEMDLGPSGVYRSRSESQRQAYRLRFPSEPLAACPVRFPSAWVKDL